jgi:DmsE family decaheme c-type cytochrome
MLSKKLIAAGWLTAALAALLAYPALAQAQTAADGVPICVTCHEKQNSTILLTAHGAQNDASGSACQACHGDATQHLKNPSDKPANVLGSKTATAAEKSAVCLTCHSGQRQLENWSIAKHRKVDVTCVNCHSLHGPQSASNNKQIKGAQFAAAPYTTTVRQLTYKRCIECHTDIRGEILKPSHHPIIEGKVGCQDCHDPHGSMTKASLRNDSLNDLCYSCHADKRGPWIHEHPPVEENCAICHTPHGSSHRALLAQKAPVLCGDCHANGHTHGIYDGRGTLPNTLPSNVRFLSSGCVECHRQIHGSNAPSSSYGQYFMR